MGGMGAMLYERAHPGTVTGVVLFAPFLGDKPLLEEIRRADGVRQSEPGPLPVEVDAHNYQRQSGTTFVEHSALASRIARLRQR